MGARSTLAKEKVCRQLPGRGCAPANQGGKSLGMSRDDENACQAKCLTTAACTAAFTFRGMCPNMESCPPVTLSSRLAGAKLFACEEAQPPPPPPPQAAIGSGAPGSAPLPGGDVASAVGDPHITASDGTKTEIDWFPEYDDLLEESNTADAATS